MANLARRITTTTTTTSSAASSRIIGGEEETEGVIQVVDDGGGIMFRSRVGDVQHGVHTRRFDAPMTTGDDGDVDEMMEPDFSDTSHMKFVDGRCSCCPYGYHVDLDFLQYLDSVNNGEYLNSLKKIHHNKIQLRKSMESYLQDQELARKTGTPGSGYPPHMLPSGGYQSTEHFMSTVEKENRGATRVLDEIDKTIEGHLATVDYGTRPGSGTVRKVLADETNRTSDISYDKRYTETIELRKVRHQQKEFDSGSSLSISSGPSSPTLPYTTAPGVNSGRTPPTETSTMPLLPKQKRLLELEKQLLELTPIPPTDHFQHTYLNSAEFGSRRPPGQERDEPEPVDEDVPKRPTRPTQAPRDDVNGDVKPDQGPSSETTRISAATLQAIREQMAASLSRMHELEEQVKAIPALQARNSVLKEEKRMLELQLQSKTDHLRSTGVGDYGIDESDFDERSDISYRRDLKPYSDGTDNEGTLRSRTTVSIGYGPDGEPIPVRVHEKELKTEENTEIREKEVKTVFLGGADDVLTMEPDGERPGRGPRLGGGRPVKKDVRSIGVGEGNVFDGSSSMEVHQKELRTVYIGDTGKEVRSTRNVGILCKPAMRDVGMVHMIDSERPMTRTIAVGVGEFGVGDGGFYSGDEGMEGAIVGVGVGGSGPGGQLSSTAMSQMSSFQAFQTRHYGILNSEQLRSVLDEMLKKEVHCVGVQCSFSTEDKGVDAARVGYDVVDVGCSDDITDVEVVPIRQMKSVAIDNRPSLFHRACGTDMVYKIDMATNTQTLGIRHDRTTNTEPAIMYPAATNTEAPVRASTAVETEKTMFYALGEIVNAGTNTNIQRFADVGFNTYLTGDVQELVIKPIMQDNSVNTLTSAVRVFDKQIATQKVASAEKAINTSAMGRFERGVNTDKPRVSAASVNTDRNVVMSRGVDCNIIVPEKKTEQDETLSQTSRGLESSRTTRVTTTETRRPTEQQEIRTRQQELRESKTDERAEHEDHTTTEESSGGRTVTRVVKTVTRSHDYPQMVYDDGDGSGGTSSYRRTITTHSGRSDDFPFHTSGDTDTSSSHRTIITSSSPRPEFDQEFTTGGRSGTTRTVTTVTHGGTSGFTEDFPAGGTTFRSLANEFGDAGSSTSGGSSSTRTVRTITRGGRSDITEDFGDSGDTDSSRRTVTTVRRSYRHGDQPANFSNMGLTSDSDAFRRTIISGDESHLRSRMEEDMSRLGMMHHGDTGDQGGYSSSRTVVKRTLMGDPSDPEQWHEETWVTEGGDTSGRQLLGLSGSEAMDTSGQHSTMSETKIERHVSGKTSSSMTSEEPLRSIMKTSRQGERVSSGHKGITFSETTSSEFEATRDLESACQIYNQWLGDSSRVTANDLSSSSNTIQKEWFKVSSHKQSPVSHVQSFLNLIENVSYDLMKQIINIADANGNTALHYAVSNCNMDVVNLLLNMGICNVDHQNKTGCTAVMMATLTDIKTERQRDIIRHLFERGDVNIQAPKEDNNELAGQTALMLAVSHGRLDMVKLLLDVGADVNLQDEDGSTALMVAAEHGHVDIARHLLSNPDCDALIKDKDGSTALSIAKEEGRQSIVSLLNAHFKTRGAESGTQMMTSQHKARKTITRITLGSPTEMS